MNPAGIVGAQANEAFPDGSTAGNFSVSQDYPTGSMKRKNTGLKQLLNRHYKKEASKCLLRM